MERHVSPYQFALFRIILGIYLLIHFVLLLSSTLELWGNGAVPLAKNSSLYSFFPSVLYWFHPTWFVITLVVVMALLSILLIIGFQRQIVAFFLFYGWICLVSGSTIGHLSTLFVGLVLLALVAIPKGEPLSLTQTENGNWRFPTFLFWSAWALMAICYTLSGIDKLLSPGMVSDEAILSWTVVAAEILFLPLSIWKKPRPIAWWAMIFLHLGVLLLVGFADLTFGLLMMHLFTFDATWFSPNKKESVAYFDGVCGVCNAFIDFLLTENQDPSMKYAPLQGNTAAERLSIASSEDLRTIIFQQEGNTYYRSRAVIEILVSSGGIWTLASVFRLVPSFLRDALYDLVAKNRYSLAGKKEACRMPTPQERARFLS